MLETNLRGFRAKIRELEAGLCFTDLSVLSDLSLVKTDILGTPQVFWGKSSFLASCDFEPSPNVSLSTATVDFSDVLIIGDSLVRHSAECSLVYRKVRSWNDAQVVVYVISKIYYVVCDTHFTCHSHTCWYIQTT